MTGAHKITPAGSYIRVRIDFIPDGNIDRAIDMGRAYIVNTGGDAYIGDYTIRIMKWAGAVSRKFTWKSGAIFDVPRGKMLGPWDVLFRLLHEVIGVRNTGACTGTGGKYARYHARQRNKRDTEDGQQAEGTRGASGDVQEAGNRDGAAHGVHEADAG